MSTWTGRCPKAPGLFIWRPAIPYPSEHAARIHSPSGYSRIRRQNNKFGAGVHAIFGVKADGKTEVQAIRFDAGKFTAAEARRWLADHNYKPIEFAPATGEEKEGDMPDEVKEAEAVEEKCGMAEMGPMVPFGVTSFAQLQAAEAAEDAAHEVHELAAQFQGIINNIMADPELADKAGAVNAAAAEFSALVDAAMNGEEMKESGEAVKAVWETRQINDFPDSSFLFIQDGGTKDEGGKTVPRSYRHFPVKDGAGKPDAAHLRNAIARIPQSNAPGLTPEKKRSLQDRARKMLAEANKESGWLAGVLDAVGEFFGLKPKATAPEPPDPGLMLWKEDGRYRWLAVFSNKYRDDDNPPEILASDAHKEFVGAVESGAWPFPELRHWHVKGTKWGTTDLLHYDEPTGFNLASGWVDKNHEKEAEALAALIDGGEVIRVSHGMPVSEIRRDADDPTVITRYRSIEISDLPGWAAANRLTGFEIKEGDMPIPDVKKEYLKKAGLSDDEIAAIEADLANKALEAEHLESKDAPVVEAAPVEAVPAPELTPDVPAPITREEIVAAIQAAVGPLQATLAELQDGLKELKETKETAAKDILAATPAFSLVQMIQGQRAVGSPEAQVEKGARVKGPKETKSPEASERVVGIPFISDLLQAAGKQQEQ